MHEHSLPEGWPLRLARQLSHAAVWAGGALTLASVLLISFDVLARRFFGFNTGGADELSSYAFAISTTWSLAFAALQRANVRVDFLYLKLPLRLAALLDWLSLVAMGIFMAVLTRFAMDVVIASWDQQSAANTTLGTPLWIPQGLWLLGLAWMCVVLGLMLVRASQALIRGDMQTLQTLCGVRSARDEADEEAAAGERLIMAERQGKPS